MKDPDDRNMLFISHAWEDFEFTKWISLKLAKEGFGVWCDLTKLLGGENWPKEINKALQRRTCKFLFVLSRSSNLKPDPLGELETARKVMKREKMENFIVPLKIDNITRDEVDYRLQEIQTISFESSWAKGLSDLIKMLDDERISRHNSFNPATVNEWWKKYGTDSIPIVETAEYLYSNRFPITYYPKNLLAHFVGEEPKMEGLVKYPIVSYKEYILSLTGTDDLQKESGIKSMIIESFPLQIIDILDGKDQLISDSKIGTYYFTLLINQAFSKGLMSKGLQPFRLSKGFCYYFDETLLVDGRIKYINNEELDPRIKLWGKFRNENWYWALRGRLVMEPKPHYLVFSHVLVQNKKGFSAAPKGVYKSWRNDKWRNKLKAAMVHLAEDCPEIKFELGKNEFIGISKEPIIYTSPVSYKEPREQLELDGLGDDD